MPFAASRTALLTGTLWTPLQLLSAIVAWHDASATGALTLTASTVASMASVTGSPSIRLTTSGTKPPVTKIGGLTALDLTAGTAVLKSPTSATTYISGATAGVSGIGTILSTTANYGRLLSAADASDDYNAVSSFALYSGSNSSTLQLTMHSSYSTVGVTAGQAFTYDAFVEAGYTHLAVNGGALSANSTSETPALAVKGLAWGAAFGGYNYLKGYIGEQIVWRRLLTPIELSLVQGYLAWKWGQQANLPASHAYAARAPYLSHDNEDYQLHRSGLYVPRIAA